MLIKQIVAFLSVFFVILALVKVSSTNAMPGITAFYDDLDGFNVATGYPAVIIDFDEITPGTDITNQTIEGIRFESNLMTPSAPLIIVRGNDTYTPSGFHPAGSGNNTLFATSGENVLSPGGEILGPGPNATVENDDLILNLTDPVSAIGFDILFQSLDPVSYTYLQLLDVSDNILYQSYVPTQAAPNWDCGSVFVGFVSDSSNIAKVVIDERDGNAQYADCNIGFDTIRFGPGDTTPPDLGLPSQNPPKDNVQPNQNTSVSVNATDPWSGIKNVTLIYSFDNGTSWEEPETMMLNSSSNLYEGTIPGQPADTFIIFKLVAYDNAGNNATLEGTQTYLEYRVIPEFSSFLVLTLFMMATLVTIVLFKRRHSVKGISI